MQTQAKDKTELFETMPIRKAARKLVIPTVLSQIVMLIYIIWQIHGTSDRQEMLIR